MPVDVERVSDQAARWFETGVAARELGRFGAATTAIRHAIAGFKRSVGARHPDTANARVELGQIMLANGEPARGLRELASATELLIAVRGGDSAVGELVAHALLVLSRALREAGRYDEARVRARHALRVAITRVGPQCELVAAAHNELGMLGKFSGRFAEAARHYRAARPLYRRLYGERSRAMAMLWHNLGGLEHARGDFRRGEPLARKAVVIARALLPANDPEVLAHEVAHAALLDGLERHAESIPVYRRALAIYTRVFGRVHYETAATLHNLAAAEHGFGQHAAALRDYRKAIACYERLLGRSHPDVALAMYNLAALYIDVDARELAMPLLRRARRIFTRRLGTSHPHTRTCERALCSDMPP